MNKKQYITPECIEIKVAIAPTLLAGSGPLGGDISDPEIISAPELMELPELPSPSNHAI